MGLHRGRSLGLGEELHSQEVASGSHGSPVGTVRSHHVAFAAQKDISLGSYDTLHIVSEGSLSKKKRLASNSFTKVPHYGESDVTDVLCDVPVTISLGLSRGKEILGAQTKEVVLDNMTDECIGTTHNVNSLPPSCHKGSSSSGKKGFKRMRGVRPRGCSNMNGVGQQDAVRPVITPEQNGWLCLPFTRDEIEGALFQMFPTKSPILKTEYQAHCFHRLGAIL
ncbi:hypothetical protein Pyn_29687 [Prunus yedoensis var. nudiflora]|uniref:Uncharacterized protein n=1 Tax=Prunus yedoensis var. nudiflora TaxID=2094558 RepID=A0A315A2N2_PRUYE|nr:hypothetical protein Pyn_29687 [Prunus yedoensis var. nudiflora]